jgi:hypothetical protein
VTHTHTHTRARARTHTSLHLGQGGGGEGFDSGQMLGAVVVQAEYFLYLFIRRKLYINTCVYVCVRESVNTGVVSYQLGKLLKT